MDNLEAKGLSLTKELEGKIDPPTVIKLTNVVKNLRKLAVRWAKLYHAERQQAVDRIKELEQELEDLKNG